MSDNSSKLIFITGGTGFIGYHVLTLLLQGGYPVRAVARGEKVTRLRTALSQYGDQVEIIEMQDLFTPALDDALKGVYGVIHVASPLRPGKDVDFAFKFAVDGSLFMLKAALHAGVSKFVVTSSTVTYARGGPYGIDDFNPITKKDIIADPDRQDLYSALKTAADKAIVTFSKQHPEMDITLIGPDYTYGPFAPGFEHLTISSTGKPEYTSVSTNGFIYLLLKPDAKWFPAFYGANDVRDSARAHVLALQSAVSTKCKRFVIVSPEECSYKDALDIIAKERPMLRDRLVDKDKVPSWPSLQKETYRKKIEEVIGLKADSYKSWKNTILDTVDSLMALENFWRSKGNVVEFPNVHPLA